jgi:hypothetical protein
MMIMIGACSSLNVLIAAMIAFGFLACGSSSGEEDVSQEEAWTDDTGEAPEDRVDGEDGLDEGEPDTIPPPTCGNDTTDAGETCDGADLNGYDCASLNPRFISGTLDCRSDCLGYDISGCVEGGTVVPAMSCSQQDVQAAIDAAADGDTVRVPEGECTWSSTDCLSVGNMCASVWLNKSVILQGAGIDLTIIRSATDGVWNTPALLLGASRSISPRVTGFTFDGDGGDTGIIRSQEGAYGFRIDHNKFVSYPGRGLSTRDDSRGVIDHNTFLNVANEYIEILGDGAASWTEPFQNIFGTGRAVFIEDNTWSYDSSFTENGANAVDSNDGGRHVFRHNRVDSWNNSQPIEAHGACAFEAGTRSFEIYENEFNILDSTYTAWNALRFRSGEGVVHSNVFTGRWGGSAIRVDEDRLVDGMTCDETIYSPMLCTHVDPMDPATWEMSDRPCLFQVHNLFVWNNDATDPPLDVVMTTEGAEQYLVADRDYFLREPSLDLDGFGYSPYMYPHPLTVAPFLTPICDEGPVTTPCWCEGMRTSGSCIHGTFE